MLHKPTWLSQEQYSILIHTQAQCCRVCGVTEDLTVDHIVPRAYGGKDENDNYQILCAFHNQSKGVEADQYWRREMYFDQHMDLERLRTFQRMFIFDKIVLDYDEWFSRPWSQISRRLYTIAGVVGSGKTLGMPTVAHALNFIRRRNVGMAARRVNRILVLTKDLGIRDQLVEDLQKDLVEYGILPFAPSVKPVDHYGLIDNQEIVDTASIWVSCIEMLYEANEIPKRNLAEVLERFPLICFDEPHWATKQVLKIVDAAQTSLCFGFTGTPIDADSLAIKSFVLLSLYSYQDATTYDGSLKYVTDEIAELPEIIETVAFEEADILEAGATRTTTSVDREHIKNFAPSKTISERVIHYIHDCDLLDGNIKAFHRPEAAVADITYPMHAIICVDRVSIAKTLCAYLNGKFDADRRRHPEDKGWHAEVIYSDHVDENSTHVKGKPINLKHPWMRCYHQLKGKLDGKCARILIVVGMGREGLNNPYCGVYGLTSHVTSSVFIVQATLGRTLRAVTRWEPSDHDRKTLHVPLARLDIPRVITHVAAQNERIIHEGLRFLLNMADHLDPMPTMEDLLGRDVPLPEAKIEAEVTFTQKERYEIAAAVGLAKQEGKAIDPAVIAAAFPTTHPSKQERMREWAELVDQNPSDARAHLDHIDHLHPAYFVTRELPNAIPTDEMLIRHIRKYRSHLQHRLDELATSPAIRELLTELYQDFAREFHRGTLQAQTKLSTIRNQYGMQLRAMLGAHFMGDEGECFKAISIAMTQILGVPSKQRWHDGSQWDRAECHVMLTRDEIRRAILGFGVHYLMKKGLCPVLATAFQISALQAEEEEGSDHAD